MWSLILYVVCMYVVFCKIDHCIHIHWCIVMGLGHNDPWVESHMWPQQTWGQRLSRVNDLWFKFLEERVSVSTYFDVFSNLILQWLQKYVIAKAGETRGSRTALSIDLIFETCVLQTHKNNMCALHRAGQCFTNEVQIFCSSKTLNYENFTIANMNMNMNMYVNS